MSAAVRERTTTQTSRKIMTHGGPISGQSDAAATTNSLENNLDALLEDLQTSVSRSVRSSRGGRTLSPQVEYCVAANPTRVISEGRAVSPMRTRTTTTEKFVSSGPSGTVSGIPGLEFLDAELQNVQPGQSKTVAYKQVSYQYNKNLDGKPIVTDSWTTSDNSIANTGAALLDDIRERTYEENTTQQRSGELIHKAVNRELIFNDSSTARSKQTSQLAGMQRDVKYIDDTANYQAAPIPLQNTLTTVHTNAQEEYGNVEYVPVLSATPAIPINLAPGPNTKVTTTIKTYTYELPGSPEVYLPGGSLPKSVVLPGDQTITYTLPRNTTINSDETINYQTVSENPPRTPTRYSSPPPAIDITKMSTTLHKEAKIYREEGLAAMQPSDQPGQSTPIAYQPGSLPINFETKTTVAEKYYQTDGNYTNGHGPHGLGERTDYPGNTMIIYQNQPPVINETQTTINRVEEQYPNRAQSSPRHPTPVKSGTPVNIYTTSPQASPPQSTTTVYKFANTTATVPPNRNAEDHEVLLPKPFPTGGVQVYPSKLSSPTEQTLPTKLEDLMASFSDSERKVLEDIQKKERQKNEVPHLKKEVDFLPHIPPKVKSKNVAGPPVYYPPGSEEFTKKEESSAAMLQTSGGWQKASGKYEYEASSKSKSKSTSGGAVVPVCLPLCCALPCVIM